MEFTKKGKILKKYGKGLAEDLLESATKEFELSNKEGEGILSRLNISTEWGIKFREEKNFSQKDRNKIINYMAERFLELALSTQAYTLYKRIDSKKAKIMEDIFPECYLKKDY